VWTSCLLRAVWCTYLGAVVGCAVGCRCGAAAQVWKSPKIWGKVLKIRPPVSILNAFSISGYVAWIQYITRHPSIYNFLYICTMEIEFRSTLHTGLMIGFACYPPEKHFSYNEVSIYLLIISVHFRWY
jgi:hypothetical protein